MTCAIGTLQDAIEGMIRDRLGVEHVRDVRIARDAFEGDDLLMVTVMLDDAGAVLDQDGLVGLVRHLRPRLAADGEMAFPIITFATEREYRDAA